MRETEEPFSRHDDNFLGVKLSLVVGLLQYMKQDVATTTTYPTHFFPTSAAQDNARKCQGRNPAQQNIKHISCASFSLPRSFYIPPAGSSFFSTAFNTIVAASGIL